ncbi:MAG: hypothetical protein HWN66_19340 [Candidatus Helarchaeota archaeon]|nr:hypothetical protein [Candidatus Helarchaeota archaeon]
MNQIEQLLKDLWNKNDSISAITVIAVSNNAILYQTDNWDIGSDLQTVLSNWDTQRGSIEIQGIHYSTLQCTPERLVCTNVRGQGHIVASREENILAIAYILPNADIGASYMAIARVVDLINKYM